MAVECSKLRYIEPLYVIAVGWQLWQRRRRKTKHERKLLTSKNSCLLQPAIPWSGFLMLQVFKYFLVLWCELRREVTIPLLILHPQE